MKITKRCKIKFSINVDFDDEAICDATLLNACEVMVGMEYIWEKYSKLQVALSEKARSPKDSPAMQHV
jgi:hypothetical protein